MRKRLIAYARVSTRLQQQSSIDAQLSLIREFCKAKRWEVVAEYSDMVSGRYADRQGLQYATTAALNDPTVDGLIVCYVDRLARNTKDFLALMELFESRAKTIVFMDAPLDASTATGRCLLTMLAAVSEMSQRQAHEKSAEGRRFLAATGKFAGTGFNSFSGLPKGSCLLVQP